MRSLISLCFIYFLSCYLSHIDRYRLIQCFLRPQPTQELSWGLSFFFSVTSTKEERLLSLGCTGAYRKKRPGSMSDQNQEYIKLSNIFHQVQRNLSYGTLPCLSTECLFTPNSGLSQNSGLERNSAKVWNIFPFQIC